MDFVHKFISKDLKFTHQNVIVNGLKKPMKLKSQSNQNQQIQQGKGKLGSFQIIKNNKKVKRQDVNKL